MKATDIPGTKWAEAWAKNTPLTNINAIPQTTATPGFASQDQGFPPICALNVAAGGLPPRIQDENGAMQFVSAWTIWMTAGGGLVPWDSSFSSAIGGYPSGQAILSATTPGAYYVSTADDNTSNPDAGGAGWVPGSLYGSLTTGDVKLSYKTAADVGFIAMNDGSFGDGSSGGTTRANADTQPLFILFYQVMTDTNCPLQNSSGGSILRSSFGAVNPTNALAAYNAHSRLVLPKMLGRSLFAAGAGSGLTSRALGQSGGAETAALIEANLPPHTHSYTATLVANQTAGSTGVCNDGAVGATTGSGNGTSVPFSILDPYASLNIFVKL